MSSHVNLWTFAILLLVTSGSVSSSLRILGIFPHFGKSHFLVFQPLMQQLSERGHDVTVLSYHPTPSAGYKDIVIEIENHGGCHHFSLDMFRPSYFSSIMEIFLLQQWAQQGCEQNIKVGPVQELLKSKKKFDIIIIEAFNTYCYLGLVHRLQAPFIQFSSTSMMNWYSSSFGQPDNPSYIHNIFMGFSSKMTFKQRVLNTIATIWYHLVFHHYITSIDNKHAKAAFGEDLPLLEDIARNASLYFVNEHFTLFQAKPVVPGVVDIGGIHLTGRMVEKIPQVIFAECQEKI